MVHHDVPIDPTGLFFSLRRPASRAPAVSAGHRATTPAWKGSRGRSPRWFGFQRTREMESGERWMMTSRVHMALGQQERGWAKKD